MPHPSRSAPDRRTFLKVAGVTAAGLVVACEDDDPIGPGDGVTLDLATDTGVLNFALALEQLEAAFYTQVVATPYGGITSAETTLMTDIRDHEIAHRDFLTAALGAQAIGDLEVDFSAVDFTSRTSVLTTARTFEDLGVAAYNGAGQRLQSADFLVVAGKIVSVEARHAAAIRDVITPRSPFSVGEGSVDVVDATGLDRAFAPDDVLAAADPFIVTEIQLDNA